jgi:hypothetical protein
VNFAKIVGLSGRYPPAARDKRSYLEVDATVHSWRRSGKLLLAPCKNKADERRSEGSARIGRINRGTLQMNVVIEIDSNPSQL